MIFYSKGFCIITISSSGYSKIFYAFLFKDSVNRGHLCILSAPVVSGQSDSSRSVVVAGYNVSAPAGSRVVLQCVSGRMVWTRDSVRDRQRVVHWDLYRASPDYAMERMVDMFSVGEQRIYNSYNLGRVSITPTAFSDGNFSLIIKGNIHCL